MAAPYICLKKSEMTNYVSGRTQGFRFTVEVTQAVNISSKVFVYQRFPNTAGAGYTDKFSNIASPTDLEEYPEDEPECAEVPFFRLDSVDLIFRSRSLAEDAWRLIKIDVAGLVQALEYAEDLVVSEEACYGTAPQSSSSGSSSPSSSSPSSSSPSSSSPSSSSST